jgi:small subunit ribosomal protein S8
MENSFIDLIIIVKNGYLAKKETVIVSFSHFKEAIAKKLAELKFIKNYKIDDDKIKKIIINLNYEKGKPSLSDVKIYSTPGRKDYISYRDLRPVLSGFGYAILSTSLGILTDKEARSKKVGGELLFSIW